MTTTPPPAYDGPIFDADSHIREKDWSFFRQYLPEKYWQDWLMAPHVLPDGATELRIGSRPIENMESADGKMAPPGKLKEWLRAIATGDEIIEKIPPAPDMYSCPERLARLDEFGVDGCVLYIGDFVGAFGLLGVLAEEKGPEGANAVFRAYNDYLHDEWSYNRDDRIYATPILSLWDLAWSVEEADRLIARGVRIVVTPMGPANGRAPADPLFDPLWKKLDDAGVAVSFHVSEANFMHPLIRAWGEQPLQSRRKGQTAWQWVFAYSELPVMMTMASFVYWNFFERFPNIRLCSAENGAEWLPRFLYKMDKMRGMARNGFWPMGQLKERPSTIFKRHCFVVAYPEDDLARIAADLDGDIGCLLMGSDYPHAEGVPTPRDFVAEACTGLGAAQIRQVMHDNGRRFLPRSRPWFLEERREHPRREPRRHRPSHRRRRPRAAAGAEWRSGWTLVFSSAVAMVVAGIPTASMGVFIAPLQEAFGWSRATITSAILTHALCVLCLSPLVGRIINRHGARRVGLAGIVAVGLAIAGVGLSGPSIASWYLAWVLVGIAQTFAGPIIWSSAIVRKFNASRGLALAVMLSGTAIATAIVAPITLFLITNWGWRAAFFAFGASAIVVCFPLIYALFRDPTAAGPVDTAADRPGEAAERRAAASRDFGASVRTWAFFKMVLCTLGVALALATLYVHMVPILKDRGLSAAEAVSVVAALGVSQLVARLLGGHLLDRFFAPYVGAFMFALVGVASLILPNVTLTLPIALVVGVLVGAGLGLELDLMAYLVSRYFRLRAYPACYGVLLGLYGIGFGIGAVLAGAAFDRFGSYDPMLWAMTGVLAGCGLLMATLGPYPKFADGTGAART